MRIDTIDPATGAVLRSWESHSDAEVKRRIASTREAAGEWADASFGERAQGLRAIAAILRSRSREWAELMASEMGKPVAQGVAEAEKCAWCCEFYADNAEAFLANEHVASDAATSYVRYEPLGVVLAIMPWNFPFWQVFRFAAPALMAGNGFLLKHAAITLGSGDAIERICAEAGLPEGLVQALVVDHTAIEGILADPRVAAVTLTGSERAGASVAEAAGRHLKKAVLELGGSDPFVVLADADVDEAADVAAKARLQNTGQSCIAAKRFIVERDVAPAFLARFEERLAAARYGDPRDPTVTLGPIARADLRDGLHRQVTDSVARGARLLLGGVVPEGPGSFYPATLLADVGPGMPAWDEEVFGPVAAVRVVADEGEAIAAANDTPYGLGASLWTKDVRRGEDLASFLECGSVFVNGMVKSDPRLPFGGIKRSGYGRELGWVGLHEFVNVKTVWIGGKTKAGEGAGTE